MTAFIRPSLILRMDLDERLFNDECVSDIKRSYSYVAPSLVQAHEPVGGQRPENVMRFMIKLHRAYWDKSDEAAQQLWEGVMPKWLHNMFSKVSNTITAANSVRAENGQPAFPYHWLELEFGDNALIAVKTGSDSSFPADGVDMVERVRDLMNAGALGQDIACVRIPSRASYEAQLAAAEQAQAESLAALRAHAAALTETRVKAAAAFEKAVQAALAELDMPKVTFRIALTPSEPVASGADKVEFLISANAGEAPRPLGKIASGGELSRIMLAMKSVFGDGEKTAVFDEIDAGVSGGTSYKVGRKLHALAAGTGAQLLCVTHSAQLAAQADTHFLIEKHLEGSRTETCVTLLDESGREKELARILGGESITEAAVLAARELRKS